MKPPIVINFENDESGRIMFDLKMLKANLLDHDLVRFKFDTGADLTVISCEDLTRLGYTHEFLQNCPEYMKKPVYTANGERVYLKYISNISIMFGDRELQGCDLHFSLKPDLHNLFGTDILRYFDINISYTNSEIYLYKRDEESLTAETSHLQIYSLKKER
ncbi:MAG: retroviral-like aspartic protease family protein [Turicibacter sp.]|nr:retroviral-like aspartic protease family protein [Turicibacter sp.]